MIIDDDPSVREGLLKHVNWEKLHVEVSSTATDGKDALMQMETFQPDLIVTDVYMPNMDGLTLIKEVSERYPDIRMVIHSGYNHFENARKAIRYGVKHFFLKPSPVSEIETVMEEVLQEIEVEEQESRMLENYQQQLPSYLAYQKDAFFRDLLSNRYKPAAITPEKLSLLNIEKQANVLVTTFMLNRPPYLTKGHEREWQLMKFSVGNILEETMQTYIRVSSLSAHLIDYSDTSYVLITWFEDDFGDQFTSNIEMANKMMENVLYFVKISVMIGMSNKKEGLHQLIDGYLESMRALEVAEYEEWNKLYVFDDAVKIEADDTLVYPFSSIKEMNQAIVEKDYDRVLFSWNELVNLLSKDKQSPYYMVQTISINILSALMMEEHVLEQAQRQPIQKSELLIKVYEQTTTKELLDWMTEQLTKWVEESKAFFSGRKTSTLVEKVKEHVYNYYDEEITLAEIAEDLYVNKNYLSQLFKKVTGESFVNFLNQYRITKAKELLREKRYMVYEVSEMVGYQNSTYFSQVFKAITGVSPSEFF